MTVSTITAKDFSIAEIILLAFRAASIVGPFQDVTNEQQQWGTKLFEVITNRLHTKGIFAKVVEFETILLAAGTFQYTVSDTALDIIGPAMFIDNTQTDLTQATAETPVTPMTRDEWQTLSTKGATGRPQRYYLHRDQTPPVLYLWPVPSATEAAAHIRFQKHRLRKTSTETAATPDFEQYWQQYFVYALAHDIALGSGLPMERTTYLNGLAKEALDEAAAYSKQRPPQQLIFNHPTRWSRPV